MRRVALALGFGAMFIQAQEPPQNSSTFIKPLTACVVRYTEEARLANLEGTLVLYVEIYPDGFARHIGVMHPLGKGLDESAIDAVKHWHFDPAKKDGRPVPAAARIEADFRNGKDATCSLRGPTEWRGLWDKQSAKAPRAAIGSSAAK